MPTDASFHNLRYGGASNMAPALVVPALSNVVALAEATDSAAITIPDGGAVGQFNATVRVRIDIEDSTATLNAAGSGIILMPNVPRFFFLPKGTWYFRTAAAPL